MSSTATPAPTRWATCTATTSASPSLYVESPSCSGLNRAKRGWGWRRVCGLRRTPNVNNGWRSRLRHRPSPTQPARNILDNIAEQNRNKSDKASCSLSGWEEILRVATNPRKQIKRDNPRQARFKTAYLFLDFEAIAANRVDDHQRLHGHLIGAAVVIIAGVATRKAVTTSTQVHTHTSPKHASTQQTTTTQRILHRVPHHSHALPTQTGQKSRSIDLCKLIGTQDLAHLGLLHTSQASEGVFRDAGVRLERAAVHRSRRPLADRCVHAVLYAKHARHALAVAGHQPVKEGHLQPTPRRLLRFNGRRQLLVVWPRCRVRGAIKSGGQCKNSGEIPSNAPPIHLNRLTLHIHTKYHPHTQARARTHAKYPYQQPYPRRAQRVARGGAESSMTLPTPAHTRR